MTEHPLYQTRRRSHVDDVERVGALQGPPHMQYGIRQPSQDIEPPFMQTSQRDKLSPI